jgi:parallel beta-helix repeat protein
LNESPDSDVYGNIIFNVTDGFYLLDQSRSIDGFTTKNRIFNNTIRNADNGIVIRLADDNVLSNNAMENITSYEYALEGGAEVAIMNQHFSDDRILEDQGQIP